MQNFYEILPENSVTAVALGYFDGVHQGHRNVLLPAAAEKQNGFIPVCFTFSESPKSILSGKNGGELMTKSDKLKVLNSLGIKKTVLADFKSIMNMSATDFFQDILVKKLRAKKLFCGFNYRFGKSGEGNAELLKELCDKYGLELCVVPPTKIDGQIVSSTLIKSLIKSGEIAKANKMLCSDFGFSAPIEHGRRLGRELGTPTLNQPLCSELVVPKFGVYCSRVRLENGRSYCGVTNIGIKPTVGSPVPLCETWMPEYSGGEIYGQSADVRLLDFIREEKKFESLDMLKNTIIDNGKTALEIYNLRENVPASRASAVPCND